MIVCAQIHRTCTKLEEDFDVVPSDSKAVEEQLKKHHAARQAVHELLKFARSEADSIMAKIKQQVRRPSS